MEVVVSESFCWVSAMVMLEAQQQQQQQIKISWRIWNIQIHSNLWKAVGSEQAAFFCRWLFAAQTSPFLVIFSCSASQGAWTKVPKTDRTSKIYCSTTPSSIDLKILKLLFFLFDLNVSYSFILFIYFQFANSLFITAFSSHLHLQVPSVNTCRLPQVCVFSM